MMIAGDATKSRMVNRFRDLFYEGSIDSLREKVEPLPLVVIIFSTYNGERYLGEQLDSLLFQTHKNIRVIVRDDGSKDGACEILRVYSRNHSNIEVLFENNIGVVSSFLSLLKMVPSDAEYVALCDQDDVWNDNKVERALSYISNVERDIPVIYFRAVEILFG